MWGFIHRFIPLLQVFALPHSGQDKSNAKTHTYMKTRHGHYTKITTCIIYHIRCSIHSCFLTRRFCLAIRLYPSLRSLEEVKSAFVNTNHIYSILHHPYNRRFSGLRCKVIQLIPNNTFFIIKKNRKNVVWAHREKKKRRDIIPFIGIYLRFHY